MRKALRCTAGTLIALGLGMGLTVPARAATLAKPPLQAAPPAPCTSPELQQLDFWVGDWELTWPAHGQAPAGTGTNHVEKILGGCAVQESFAAAGPQGLVGRSMSAYNPQLKIWEQTWVDNQGSYIALTGGLKDGAMTLTQRALGPDGKPHLVRMVFLNIKPDSFDWHWESSTDEGKTWKLAWEIHYKRKGAPKAELSAGADPQDAFILSP